MAVVTRAKRTVQEWFNEKAKVQPTMQWVSVEDQLPIFGDVVLAATNDQFILASFNGKQWFIDEQEVWEIENVIYWCKIVLPIHY